MDMETFNNDFVVDASSSKHKVYEVPFESLPQEAVEELIRKDIDHICSIFGVNVSNNTLVKFASHAAYRMALPRCCCGT